MKHTRLLAPIVLWAAASPLGAQAIPYGTGCFDFFSTLPTITATAFPVTGQPFDVRVEARPNSLGLLVAGTSNTSWAGAPLPLNLFPLGFGGCFLNASVDVVAGFPTDSAGVASFPTVGWKAGVTLFFQALMVDTSDPNNPGAWSQGLAVTTHAGATANLLVNPGAETGDSAGWTPGATSFAVTGVAAQSGAFSFEAATPPFGGTAEKSQTVDLLAAGVSQAELDQHTGVVYRTFVRPTCTICKPFFASMRVRLFDVNDNLLAEKSVTLNFFSQTFIVSFFWNEYALVFTAGTDYPAGQLHSIEVTESIAPGFGGSAFLDESAVVLTL